MRRAFVIACVLGLALVASERRLADPRLTRAADLAALWEPVVEHTRPLQNCVFVTAEDPDNRFAFTAAADGVRFDIDADGTPDRVSWTQARSGVAFLAIDHDADGRIGSGRELIGEHTWPEARNAPNALMALAAEGGGLDRKAVMDAEAPLFARLQVWIDANHNGRSEPSEVRMARDVLAAIGLGFSPYHRRDEHDNQSRYSGFVYVRTAPGLNPVRRDEERARWRPLYEVCLATLP